VYEIKRLPPELKAVHLGTSGHRRKPGPEDVKELGEEKNNSRKDAKAQRVAKQTKEFSFALLCAFATLREIVYFFTASKCAISDYFSGILSLPPSFRLTSHVAGRMTPLFKM
jgi:hypothetical protein